MPGETMAEQTSRLAIILDSTGAQRNAEEFSGALARITQAGEKASSSTEQLEGSTKDLNASFNAGAKYREGLIRDMSRATSSSEDQAKAFAKLRAQIDPVSAALDKLDEQQKQLNAFNKKGFIDTETFDIYSQKLEATRNKLTGFNEGMEKGTISAGQYKNAMRQLPAQLTDIFTSLAGGMPLWLVFTQQGGQIADSFGGWGSLLEVIKEELLGLKSSNDEASDSLSDSANGLTENVENGKKFLGFLTPTRIALGGAAAAVAALTYAYYRGSQEQDEFAKSLILSGNIIGKTTGQLAHLTSQVADSAGSTRADAADVLNQLVNAGKVTKESLNGAAEAILKLSDAAGISTQQLVSDFNSIGSDPVSAISKLNEQYNFLTLATYNQIRALQEQGDQEEAARVASDAYASAMSQRADDISDSLGSLQKAWKWLSDEAKGAWDSMLNIGRESTLQNQLDTLNYNIAETEKQQREGGVWNRFKANASGLDLNDMRRKRDEIQSQITTQDVLTGAISSYNEAEQRRIKLQQQADRSGSQFATAAEKRTKAIAQEKRFLDAGVISLKEYESRIGRINEMFKDPTPTKTKAYSDDAGQRMLLELQQQQAALEAQQRTGYKISAQQEALIKWEQQLADIKNKQTLTADQKSLLANSDLITAQFQQNAALEKQIETREKLLALDKARADIERTITNRQNQYATDELLAGGGLSQYDQQQYTQRLALEQSYNDRISQLRQQRASATTEIARQEVDQEIQLQQQALQTELSNYDTHMQRMNDLRGSFTAGASRAWQEYQDSASNASAMSQQLFSDAFTGMEDAVVKFAMTGKASFTDFANSILADIARIAARQALVGLGTSIFSAASGMFAGGASAASASASSSNSFSSGAYNNLSLNAKGGVYDSPSLSAYSGAVYDSPQFFAFAKGAGVFGEAGPEAIMPLTRSSDGSLGVRMVGGDQSGSMQSGDINITQHFNISGNGDAALQRAMEEAARKGANDGAKRARQDMLQDFQNRGQGRRLLGV